MCPEKSLRIASYTFIVLRKLRFANKGSPPYVVCSGPSQMAVTFVTTETCVVHPMFSGHIKALLAILLD